MTIRAFSFGGGVQSTAALVLAAQGEIEYPLFLFANVGDDSEYPATLTYVHEVAAPYAKAHGIELVELRRLNREGQPVTLLGKLEGAKRSIDIPVRMSDTGAPGNRNCTQTFKIEVVAKELKRLGATKDQPATVGLGISLDEFHRMRTDSGVPHYGLEYPLIERRIDRAECQNIIERAGLPVPPKSSCWFCPYHTRAAWRRMLREEPELFAKSVALERRINDRRATLGKDPVWLSRALKPLDEAVTDDGQIEMSLDACESGYCGL